MRAVQINGFGGPEQVFLAEAARPEPKAGEVLVRVAAAGVNPVDWKIREGYMKDAFPFHFPTTLGTEFSGVIEALGPDVTGFAVGDAVYGSTGALGSYADYVAIHAGVIAKAPASISLIEAAALPVAVVTTEAAFATGPVGKGSRVLIHAAAGGVGSIAVQLAHELGAEVTALASAGNIEFGRGLGADHVIDRNTDYESQIGDFDLILDAFGPPAQERSWGLLRKGGMLVSLVFPPDQARAESLGVRAAMAFGLPKAEYLANAARLVDAGKLAIHIAATYPIEDVSAALALVQGGQVRGKVVLTL